MVETRRLAEAGKRDAIRGDYIKLILRYRRASVRDSSSTYPTITMVTVPRIFRMVFNALMRAPSVAISAITLDAGHSEGLARAFQERRFLARTTTHAVLESIYAVFSRTVHCTACCTNSRPLRRESFSLI